MDNQLTTIIKTHIRRKGITMGQFAESIGMSSASLSSAIRGDMKLSTLKKIINGLGMELYLTFEGNGYKII